MSALVELLLLRHGIAEERRPDRPDAPRRLTAEGHRRTAAVLAQLHRLGLTADRLVSSPLIRAQQTAELAVRAALAPALTLADALAPGGDPLPLLACLAAGGAAPRRLLLVGHEPDLGDLAARLIGARPGSLSLKKAGLAVLDLQGAPAPAAARLRLLLAPRQILGGS